jgi:hypothetical protein
MLPTRVLGFDAIGGHPPTVNFMPRFGGIFGRVSPRLRAEPFQHPLVLHAGAREHSQAGIKRGSAMRLAHLTICAGVCAVPLCAWASVFHSDLAPQPFAPSTVERATKGDRTLVPFGVGVPGVSVEIGAQPNSAITVRNPDGSLIYQIDPATRMTIVAKRTGRTHSIPATSAPPKETPAISLPLPEGCEGAFSPYAAPDKAHVIGRCIS